MTEEVVRLKRDIEINEQIIKEKTTQREELLAILQEHGALEEYTLFQKRHMETVSELHSVTSSIGNLKMCQTGLSQVKIEQEMTYQKARRDYEERLQIWEKSIRLFNKYSEALYNAPGKLVIDVGQRGLI